MTIKISIQEILEGLHCEKCMKKYYSLAVYPFQTDELYLYLDLTGTLRVFCKEHMSFSYNNDGKLVPCYSAEKISNVFRKEGIKLECDDEDDKNGS